MKNLIGFKVFKDETDFLNWQREKERVIFQISPWFNNVDVQGDEQSVQATPNTGCFVTYTVDDECDAYA